MRAEKQAVVPDRDGGAGAEEWVGRAGEAQYEQRLRRPREQGLFEIVVLNSFAKPYPFREPPDARETVTGPSLIVKLSIVEGLK